MELINSIKQIIDINALIRNKRQGFITNFYLENLRHSIWIKKKSLYCEWIGDTCFLFRKNASFWNAFYISTTTQELESSLALLKQNITDEALFFDIVGKKNVCDEIEKVFVKNGFARNTSLVRFTKTINLPVSNDPEIEKVQRATEAQTIEVHRLLHKYMDERIEQIPDIEEYEEWGKAGHILVYTVNNQIAGFFDYEKTPSTTFPRHWLVVPEFRGLHIGAILFRRFLYEANDTKRIVSWVIQTNDISIKEHHLNGFQEENLYDYIMSNQ